MFKIAVTVDADSVATEKVARNLRAGMIENMRATSWHLVVENKDERDSAHFTFTNEGVTHARIY